LVTVTGKVTKQGQAVSGGSVVYLPEDTTAKNPVAPKGAIQADGTYELRSEGQPGAPLGKYKVIIQPPVGSLQMQDPSNPKWTPPAPTKAKPSTYEDPKATPLRKEVVEGAGPTAYDIALQ
jgi:hypothetical protein